MTDSFSIYKQQQAAKGIANAPAAAPFETLESMLHDLGLFAKLGKVLDLNVFDDRPLRDESLAVLAARVGEDRSGFLKALLTAGVSDMQERQQLCNALGRAVREGRIVWSARDCGPKEPERCAHCGALPAANKKLLTCGKCKTAKYCNAGCQKSHWVAGHKASCKAPAKTPSARGGWADINEESNEISDPGHDAWTQKVSTGGWGGHPVLGMKGEVIDRRPD